MQNKTIKLTVWRKENQAKGRKFSTYFTKCVIPVKKGEKNYVDEEKFITVKFRQSVTNVSIKNKAVITVNEKDINMPYYYEVKVGTDGKKEYPCIWIRNNVISCVEIYPKPSVQFVATEEDTSSYDIPDEMPFK